MNKFTDAYWLSKVTPKVLVGVSGGKDSVAALDVCRRAGIETVGYFMYIVKGLSYQDEYIDYLSERYHTPIFRYPHPDRVMLLREGRYCLAQDHLPKLEFRDIWEAARRDTKTEWIVTGEKKRDSLERRAQLVSWGNIQPARHRGFPLAEWSNKDVYEYLTKHNVPLSPEYQIMGHSVNGFLSGETLEWMHDHFPDDYQKVLRDFPLAESSRIRHISTGGKK